MDLRGLQLFRHLATSLHFGDTAEAMYVSPSTLSRAIQRLEEECGALLFKRDNRSVELTHAGEKVLEFSNSVLQQWQTLQHELNSDSDLLQGEITLFCSVTASQSHLPAVLQRFRKEYPLVDIRLLTGDPALAIKYVKEQRCDIAIAINSPDFPADLVFKPLDKVPLRLIAPREWRLKKLNQVDWRKHQVIMPELGPTRRIAYQWFAEHAIRPNVYAHVAGNEAIVSMVALGCGLAFVPQVVLDHSTLASSVSVINVKDVEAYELGLCCQQSRNQEALIEALFQLELN